MRRTDSFGVMPDCKHGVNNPSTDLLTRRLNGLFTVIAVAKERPKPDPIAEFVLDLGEKRFGSVAKFSSALFGEDKRQQVGQWRYRGIPANQEFNVSQKLGMTVEQLRAAGKIPVKEPPLSQEAIEFAREWTSLEPLVRTQIQALVRTLTKEQGRIEGGKPSVERPRLQRSQGA